MNLRGWCRGMKSRQLIDICNPKQWKTISTSELEISGYPVYGANGIIGFYSEYNHEDPTVLITCRGATCGEIHICEPKSYVTGNAMALDDLSDEVDIRYLYYFLRGYDFKNIISGSAQPQITRQGLQKLIVKYPNLETQKKIVEALDKAQDLIDARKEQIRLMDELVKSRFVEMFGDPVINPMNWDIKTLGEFTVFLTSGSRGWSEYFSNEGKMFLTIKNVKNSKIDTSNIQYVNPPETQEAVRTKVKEKDLLISITADLGRTGVITKEIAEFGAYINQHLSLVRVDTSNINPLYISYYLESDSGRKQFESKNQSAVKAGLNFNAIRSLNLLVPPLELQNEFEKYVQQIENSKLDMQTSLNEIITTQQALMQQYFG